MRDTDVTMSAKGRNVLSGLPKPWKLQAMKFANVSVNYLTKL